MAKIIEAAQGSLQAKCPRRQVLLIESRELGPRTITADHSRTTYALPYRGSFVGWLAHQRGRVARRNFTSGLPQIPA